MSLFATKKAPSHSLRHFNGFAGPPPCRDKNVAFLHQRSPATM
jgi:hypothetical protein